MAKQIEKKGIPVALITALPGVAKNVGVSRIIQGIAINHPAGNPLKSKEKERLERTEILKKALTALLSDVEKGHHLLL